MWDKPQILNWIADFFYALAAVMLLYGVLYVVVHLPIFPLREVRVEGELHHVTREQLKLIAERHLKGNFFTLDLAKARDAFEKLPWARNVSVRRRWPDRLEVTVEEHRELARWGNVALVNSYGELFQAASDSELPVFYGPADGVREVAEHYAKFSGTLAAPGLGIAQLVRSPRRAWTITTDKGMVIVGERLQKFASAYRQTIGELEREVRYADLRYPNGFAVRKPGSAARAGTV